MISSDETILYGARGREEPVAKTVKRGSNRLREELKAVTQLVAAGSHGKMEAAR